MTEASAKASSHATGVKVLAWLTLILGAWGIVASIGFLLMRMIMPLEAIFAMQPGVNPEQSKIFVDMFRFQSVFLACMLPVYALKIFAGVGALKRREWSRKLLLGLGYLYIAVAISAPFLMFRWFNPADLMALDPKIKPELAKEATQVMRTMMQVMSFVMAVIWGAIAGGIVYFLRLEKTKAVFEE